MQNSLENLATHAKFPREFGIPHAKFPREFGIPMQNSLENWHPHAKLLKKFGISMQIFFKAFKSYTRITSVMAPLGTNTTITRNIYYSSIVRLLHGGNCSRLTHLR